jgi:hypothetical protein
MRTFAASAAALCGCLYAASTPVDLSRASVTSATETAIAGRVLLEEVQKRSGIRLSSAGNNGPAIRILFAAGEPSEGFHFVTSDAKGVTIEASSIRGAMYGVGYLLRHANLSKGKFEIASGIDLRTSPKYRLRGHQIGYRTTANSWDAWTIAQYDQYIRDLVFFGVNAIENIPFQDDRKNPLMKVPRREMNRAISEICKRYGIEHWVWTPATIDLKDEKKEAELLAQFDELFRDLPQLDGIFFPGGDPGSNPPELVLPFLQKLAKRQDQFPNARIWLSLQGFHGDQPEYVYKWIDQDPKRPWFGGIVVGPSSPSLADTRHRLPAGVGLRLYPDITHNKIAQFEVPDWDQAYALTLGREAVNPRPYEYASIFRRIAPLSDGFISYSDGVHDDVNKNLWNALSWDPDQDVRDIVIEYCRLHFGSEVAEESAEGILALERNWRGPLPGNGGVEATLRYWQGLEKRFPALDNNWRWQMCLLRANYDAYVRRRLLLDTKLEEEANAILLAAKDPDAAIRQAQQILNRWPEAGQDLRARITELCAKLFESIGLQTSVEKYHASGAERGAVLDFLDNPVNNRWWLEDEFAKVQKLSDSSAKLARLREIAMWEHPGPGSFYDAVGVTRKSPRTSPPRGGTGDEDEDTNPLFWWLENGKSHQRLSWQATRWPAHIRYEGLDPKARYVVRTQGYGQCLLRVDGVRVKPVIDGKEVHEFKEFVVPAEHLADGKLVLTFDIPTDEGHLNWRRKSRLAEVWLLKR